MTEAGTQGEPVSKSLITVGSSAGGVEALSIFVSTLTVDFPAPIVLAQHLDPDRVSSLDTILQHRTQLPVEVVMSRSKLQAGRIYVIPSNHLASIHDHYVEVKESHSRRPRPSVDTLFSTAAEAYGENLIAVILTGSGTDGSVGAVDVKDKGGVVIVQDPQTARYPSMPASLPPTVIDFALPIERIGPFLQELLHDEHIQQSEEKVEDVLRDILELVSRQASIDFRPYKTSTILRRVARRMAVTHSRSMREYAQYLKATPEEVGELVKAFLINVTQFFRDAEAFSYLRNEILPKLITRARTRNRVLRFWAAGCATGEEPYSLAMLLTDMLGAELLEWSVKIFATDLDEAAINFARRGIYAESLLKGIPKEYRERFFEPIDNGYRISKALRQMVIFGQQDLSRSAPFPRIDLVLCRNVLIYFTPELQEYVLNQFAFSLSPDGYLFLGKAETVRPVQSFYELINKQWKVYRCIGNGLPSMRHQLLSERINPYMERQAMKQQNMMSGKSNNEQDSANLALDIGQLRRFNELLLRFLPIGIVVIDRSYRILTANGSARRLLGLREIGTEQDFLHAVRGIPYHDTRAAIDSVFRERNSVSPLEVELDMASGGNGRYVSLSISLMQMESDSSTLAVISIADVTQQVQFRRQLETVQAEQTQLMNELSTANKRLSDVNKELVDANEELQVTNEELMLTHEELQASIEEFETTNEELQATNEELETNNEELQATNEELETTNDELRARSSELQEMTATMESERGRLAKMIELAPFYILVLRGPTLIVDAYSPRYARLLSTRSVYGRALDEVLDIFWDKGIEILHLARDAYRLDEPRTLDHVVTPLPQGDVGKPVEAYFAYTLIPSHDTNGKVDGVIIYAVDETEKRLLEVEHEREQFELIFRNFPAGALALFDAQSQHLLLASSRYLESVARVTGLPQDTLIGRCWEDLRLALPAERRQAIWEQALIDGQSVHIADLSVVEYDDHRVVWDYTLLPVMDTMNAERVRYMLVVAIEMTDQVLAREELEKVDQLKDEFISLVTHELRNPLSLILANVQRVQRMLNKRSTDGTGHAEQSFDSEVALLEKITYQVGRMNKLISEMLDVARIRGEVFELHGKEEVNLVEMIRQICEQYASTEQQDRILVQSQEDVINVMIDKGYIEQVLHNLITNALKYSPQQSEVRIEVQNMPNEAVVAIHDKGRGISKEDQKHLFERFYRGHDENERVEGLGLGLYIAHAIIARHGGRFWLESEPGKGSSFYFSLPHSL
ncbi:CheR family methyltransferase [Dictyobacter aurantiacus]|uniref:Chemotaxis methyltransferase n=1 Tax=Dictyobacter aurantiacus TaxID=1936993 RepID=A0A401ZPR0_9CHLR|nr:CheR family methyltransferase [Dictyobacter aurantiacus]GCE08822.1 chemotaxis methyltransferase [Dictyobacter aurantiacus]